MRPSGIPLYIPTPLKTLSLGSGYPLASPPMPLGGWEAEGVLWRGAGRRDLR